MDWQHEAFNSRRHDIRRQITSNNRYISLSQPWQTRRVKPGGSIHDIPFPFGRTTCPTPGSNEHDVAALNGQPSFLLPGVEVFGIDCFGALEILFPQEPWDIY